MGKMAQYIKIFIKGKIEFKPALLYLNNDLVSISAHG